MRSVTVRTADLKNIIINLGFVGENEHRQIRFDAKKDFEEYPNASASLTVVPPEGESYPAIIERDGDYVLWTITDSDVIGEGDGEIQLAFTEGEVVKRTCIGRTKTDRSLVPTGSIPSGIDDFIVRAGALLEQVEDTFPAGGTTGQVLAKKSDTDYDTEWVDQGGGTEDYDELENRPQIGGVTLTGNKTLHDLGAASEGDVDAKYTKPAGGIPASDIADGVIPDPEDLIDDTAGEGDTDKVWSADKSHELLTQINSKADKTVTDAFQKNKAPVIIDHAEGNPIVLTDGADGLPVESMKIHFLPKQDTSGGDPSPSHVCPISGWTGLTAYRAGKNLIKTDKHVITSTIVAINAESNDDYPTFLKAGTYTISFKRVNGVAFGVFMKESKIAGNVTILTGSSTATSKTFTIDADGNYRFWIYKSSGAEPGMIDEIQLELGETASPYAPYTGQSYPIIFPDGQTIYGATVYPLDGKMLVEWELISTKWKDWSLLTSQDGYTSKVIAFTNNVVLTAEQAANGKISNVCTHVWKDISYLQPHFYIGLRSSSPYAGKCVAYMYLPDDFDGEQVVQATGKLQTPYEIQLDTIAVQTLLGDNVIWSDANGTIELDYRADTKLFIAKQKTDIRATIAPIEDGATASQAYSAGKFFYHDGQFCKAKTSIASGATFTLNTNYQITTVADELFALN